MIGRIYQSLPKSAQRSLKKNFIFLSPKPFVMRDIINAKNKFPDNSQGGVIITADFELAWAVRYSKKDIDPLEFARRERKNVPFILEASEKFSVPITWATVGHLFLESCKKGEHDWMHRIPYFDRHWKYTEGDWFDCDPNTSYDIEPEWYAPDLIKKIIDSEVNHEVGCHTFSHINCSDEICPRDVIDDELKACVDIAKKWNISLTSLAFPGGTAGNYDTLKKYGIEIYRRRIKPYEIAYPFRDSFGLLVTPTGPAITIAYHNSKISDEFKRYKHAINKAIKHNSLIHLWFHPSASERTFTELFPLILQYCAMKRDSGELWIGTMDGMQKHINKNRIL